MVEKSPATAARGAKRSFTPFSVTFVLRCLPFRKARGQRKTLGRFYGAGEAERLPARK